MQRSGMQPNETHLTQANVVNGLHLIATLTTTDNISTQPLVCDLGAGVVKVIVATQDGYINAFPATALGTLSYPCTGCWRVFAGAPYTAIGGSDFLPNQNMGCIPTPVIDPATAVLYEDCQIAANNGQHLLLSLNVRDGSQFAAPLVINATDTSSGVLFSTNQGPAIERNGLFFTGSNVCVSYASHGDAGIWYPWIICYNKTTLAPTLEWCGTCSSHLGGPGLWGGISVDTNGDLFFAAGNATVIGSSTTLTASTGTQTLSVQAGEGFQVNDVVSLVNSASLSMNNCTVVSYVSMTLVVNCASVTGSGSASLWQVLETTNFNPGMVHLSIVGGVLTQVDYFTPSNYQSLTAADSDFDTNITIFNTNFLIAGGKSGIPYVANKAAMGHLQGGSGNPPVFQVFTAQANFSSWYRSESVCNTTDCWFATGNIQRYHWLNNTVGFDMSNSPVAYYATTATQYSSLGPQIAYSWDGVNASSAVIWCTCSIGGSGFSPKAGALVAFEPQALGQLYTSAALTSDAYGNVPKLTGGPTVANGLVYVPTRSSQVAVYGVTTSGFIP